MHNIFRILHMHLGIGAPKRAQSNSTSNDLISQAKANSGRRPQPTNSLSPQLFVTHSPFQAYPYQAQSHRHLPHCGHVRAAQNLY